MKSCIRRRWWWSNLVSSVKLITVTNSLKAIKPLVSVRINTRSKQFSALIIMFPKSAKPLLVLFLFHLIISQTGSFPLFGRRSELGNAALNELSSVEEFFKSIVKTPNDNGEPEKAFKFRLIDESSGGPSYQRRHPPFVFSLN